MLRLRVLVLCLSSAIVAAGCDDAADRESPPQPAVSAPACCSYVEGVYGVHGPYTVEGAVRGGSVTVLTHAGLRHSLDPVTATDRETSSLLGGLVTRSLEQWHYDARTRQTTLYPDLATDLGTHNDRFTEWKMTVRDGVRYEDGRRVAAADVARGIRRCLATAGSPCVGIPLRRVTVNGNTLTFHLSAPYQGLPDLAATPAFGPIEPGVAVGTLARHPVSTGPYEVASYSRGRHLVLERNDAWDPGTDPGRSAYPDSYDVRSGVPSATIDRRILSDASGGTTMTYDSVDMRRFLRAGDGEKVAQGADGCTTYAAPDNRTIGGAVVRRALGWAFPYRAALRSRGLLPDVTAVPARGVLPPGVPFMTPYDGGRPGFRTDPARARRMLRSVHALGTRVRFLADEPGLRRAMVRSLRAAGFDPQPQRRLLGRPQAVQVDLRIETSCGPWRLGDPALSEVYAHTSARRYLARRVARIERLPIEQATRVWGSLDRAVARRFAAVLPLWYGVATLAHGSRIRGFDVGLDTGMPAWSELWVAP